MTSIMHTSSSVKAPLAVPGESRSERPTRVAAISMTLKAALIVVGWIRGITRTWHSLQILATVTSLRFIVTQASFICNW
jgi:hypothetical protein